MPCPTHLTLVNTLTGSFFPFQLDRFVVLTFDFPHCIVYYLPPAVPCLPFPSLLGRDLLFLLCLGWFRILLPSYPTQHCPTHLQVPTHHYIHHTPSTHTFPALHLTVVAIYLALYAPTPRTYPFALTYHRHGLPMVLVHGSMYVACVPPHSLHTPHGHFTTLPLPTPQFWVCSSHICCSPFVLVPCGFPFTTPHTHTTTFTPLPPLPRVPLFPV